MHDQRIDTRPIAYATGDWQAEGYLSTPADASRPRPCVLVAHDWSGLNVHAQATADRLAGLGYVALAVDVYGRDKRGDPEGDNAHLMAPLMADRGLLRDRLLAGLSAAQGLDAVDAARIAIVGYCFGGLCALDLARASPPGLRCAISIHGSAAPPPGEVPRPIKPRLLILHGWEDPLVPTSDLVADLRTLSEAGATWELHAYAHAVHAFTFKGANFPERGIVHHPLADRRSWTAATGFLAECLLEGDEQTASLEQPS